MCIGRLEDIHRAKSEESEDDQLELAQSTSMGDVA